MSLHRNDWPLGVKLKRAKVRKDLEVTNCDLKPLRDLALVAIPRLVQLERVHPEALKIYVDTASDVRFIRRLQRDISERGRSTESVVSQYLETVRPMHKQFIEPTKRNADVILPHGANGPAVELITTKVMSLLREIKGS